LNIEIAVLHPAVLGLFEFIRGITGLVSPAAKPVDTRLALTTLLSCATTATTGWLLVITAEVRTFEAVKQVSVFCSKVTIAPGATFVSVRSGLEAHAA